MEQLVAFITSYLLAAFFFILGGTPFTAFVVLFLNFLITVPLAIALGFDKSAEGLIMFASNLLAQQPLAQVNGLRVGRVLTAGAAERLIPPMAIEPIDFRVFMLPQAGHACVSLDCDMRNFLSNGCPHS